MNGQDANLFAIFGGTGDLSYRKLMPALYNLHATGRIDQVSILAIGRRDYSCGEYIEIVKSWVKNHSRIEYKQEIFDIFANKITYHKMDFTNADEYEGLSQKFCAYSAPQCVFYYAVAPKFFDVISDGILSMRCTDNAKIVIEKPFGETIERASILSEKLEHCFGKENIYRIDHYLGKDMVRNLLTTRFTNPIIESSWDAQHISHVHILSSEQVGVETRAGYYDGTGALVDMFQNHLLQILTLVAMERPRGTNVTESQTAVLKSLRPATLLPHGSIVLAQYDGYKSEPGVSSDSTTETYAYCKLFVDNKRWKDVPFYVVTGKKLATREMNVVITFKPTPGCPPNTLVFKIQPTEGVCLKFNVNSPNESGDMVEAEMDFCGSCNAPYRLNTPEAYERLIDAVLCSDATWFSSWEHIRLSWEYTDALKRKFSDDGLSVQTYAPSSRGPGTLDYTTTNMDYTQFYCKL